MSRLIKSIHGFKNSTLGLLKKPDGTYTANPEETISILMDEHFPASEEISSEEDNRDEYALPHNSLAPHYACDANEVEGGCSTSKILKGQSGLSAH